MKRIRALSVGCSVVAAATTILVPQLPAAAATGNILPPFTAGESWTICQGYNSAHTHNGTSRFGIDLTGAGCGNSAAGRAARAPRSGSVAYWQPAYGNLCVNFSGGSYTLTHINASVTRGAVSAGQRLGTVAAAGQRNNGGVAHIHFQMWSRPNCYNSSPIPLDAQHHARMCGAPDLTAKGPAGTGNGTWSGIRFTGARCGTTRPATWKPVGSGRLTQLDLGPQGQLWGVNAAHNVYQYAGGGRWAARGTGFVHVTVGAVSDNGPVVYAVRTDNSIARWRVGKGWEQVGSGRLVQLDLGPQGQLWGVSAAHRVYQYAGRGRWTFRGSGFRHVTVGRVAGTGPFVYAVRTDNSIARWRSGKGWEGLGAGRLVQLDLGPQGQLWGVNAAHNVYQYAGRGAWTKRGAGFAHVTVGKVADGGPFVYATRTNSSIARWG